MGAVIFHCGIFCAGFARLLRLSFCIAAFMCAKAEHALSANVWIEPNQALRANVIVLHGQITKGDLFKVQDIIDETRKRDPRGELLLAPHSPGGMVSEALLIALLVRRKGVGTILLPGTGCASACALMFFGGFDLRANKSHRIALRTSRLAVHSIFLADKDGRPAETLPSGKDPNVVYQDLQRRLGKLIWFLNEVGITSSLQSRLFETEYSTLHVLSEAELIANGITLRPADGHSVPAHARPAIQVPAPVAQPSPTIQRPARPSPSADSLSDKIPLRTGDLKSNCEALAGLTADSPGPLISRAEACMNFIDSELVRLCSNGSAPPLRAILVAFIEVLSQPEVLRKSVSASEVFRQALSTLGRDCTWTGDGTLTRQWPSPSVQD